MITNISIPKYICKIHKTEMDVIWRNDSPGGFFRCEKCEDLKKPTNDLKTILCDFADWLHKKGYIDTDYYAEEPKAIDAYLKTKK